MDQPPSTGELIQARVTPDDSCGTSFAAFTIYFLFQILMAYIVLSIMIGVILENFNSIGSPNQNVSIDDIEFFREVWLKYDPTDTYRTAAHNILAIISQLNPPLGVKGVSPPPTRTDLLRQVQRLNLPDHNGQIHFNETLTHLSKVAQERDTGEIRLPDVDAVRKIAKLSEGIPGLKTLEGAQHNTYTNYVLALLQTRFRAYRERTLQRTEADEKTRSGGAVMERSSKIRASVGAATKRAASVVASGAKSVAKSAMGSGGGATTRRDSSDRSSVPSGAPVVMALAHSDVPATATVKGVALVRPRQ